VNESDACFMPAADLVASYQAKTLSPVEVAQAVLARINRLNPMLNAFVLIDEEGALASAQAAEKAYASGSAGPLAGVPLSIKDLTETRGMRTTKGSVTGKEWVPETHHRRLQRRRGGGSGLRPRAHRPRQ